MKICFLDTFLEDLLIKVWIKLGLALLLSFVDGLLLMLMGLTFWFWLNIKEVRFCFFCDGPVDIL